MTDPWDPSLGKWDPRDPGPQRGSSTERGFYISREISQVDRSLVLNSNSISYILVTAYYFQVLLVILDTYLRYELLPYHYLTIVRDGSLLLSHISVREPLHPVLINLASNYLFYKVLDHLTYRKDSSINKMINLLD